jgi:peptidoglycan/LPS O-acetylase OafA/YrhL
MNSSLVFESPFIATIGYTLIGLAYAGLVLRSLDDTSRVSRVLRWRPLHSLGTISYGFYMIHMLPLQRLGLFNAHHRHWSHATPVITFLFTVTLATLSFRYLETPFLRLKRVLAPQRSQNETAHPHVSEPAV